VTAGSTISLSDVAVDESLEVGGLGQLFPHTPTLVGLPRVATQPTSITAGVGGETFWCSTRLLVHSEDHLAFLHGRALEERAEPRKVSQV
jgi:hypothetical protein